MLMFFAYFSLGQELRAAGHRVRLATHNTFRKFVRGNGLEFFPLAGDPADLMSFMVKNSGIIPSVSSIAAGDLTKNRHVLTEILASTWRACTLEDDETGEPFTAEAIIANPPSFGHIHCAQKLQIPLHIMFTMPWSPTTAFPHPLVNVDYSKASIEKVNMLSYSAIEMFVRMKRK
jgi:sterol 3beta-glucosyltransferase